MREPIKHQRDWDRYLPHVGLAYRSCVQESTGLSPNMLMLGREVPLPVDLTVEEPDEEEDCGTDYATELRDRIREVHERTRTALRLSAERQKKHYDRHTVGGVFKVGQFVWLHQKRRTGGPSKKLSLPWEGPYLVVTVMADVIYRIQKSPCSKCQVVHGDRLKAYQGKPLTPWLREDQQPMKLDDHGSQEDQDCE